MCVCVCACVSLIMSEKSELSLSELVAVGDYETLQARLDAGADVNEEDPKSGDTALDAACYNLLRHTVSYLLEHGADCNKRHKVTGATPLHKLVSSPKGLLHNHLLFFFFCWLFVFL